MNLRRLAARTAVVGLSTTLAAGALVSGGTVAANAAGGTGNYTCASSFSPLPVSVTVDADLSWVPALTTGQAIQADLLHFAFKFVVPEAAVTAMRNFASVHEIGTTNASFGFTWGDGSIPVTGLNLPKTATPATGDFGLKVPGQGAGQGAFRVPSPGKNLAVKLPKTFTMTAITDSPAAASLPLTCTINGDAPTLATITVNKQASTVTAKAPKSAKAGKKVKIAAKVTGLNVPATGKVVAKDGKKVVGTGTLKKGKATIVVKKGLKKGKHTIVVSYAGDKKTNKARAAGVVINVKK